MLVEGLACVFHGERVTGTGALARGARVRVGDAPPRAPALDSRFRGNDDLGSGRSRRPSGYRLSPVRRVGMHRRRAPALDSRFRGNDDGGVGARGVVSGNGDAPPRAPALDSRFRGNDDRGRLPNSGGSCSDGSCGDADARLARLPNCRLDSPLNWFSPRNRIFRLARLPAAESPRAAGSVGFPESSGWRGCPTPAESPRSTGSPRRSHDRLARLPNPHGGIPRSAGCEEQRFQVGEVAQLWRNLSAQLGPVATAIPGWRGCPTPDGGAILRFGIPEVRLP